MLISLIVPCYNEEEALPIFYKELCAVTETIPEHPLRCVQVPKRWVQRRLLLFPEQESTITETWSCGTMLRFS